MYIRLPLQTSSKLATKWRACPTRYSPQSLSLTINNKIKKNNKKALFFFHFVNQQWNRILFSNVQACWKYTRLHKIRNKLVSTNRDVRRCASRVRRWRSKNSSLSTLTKVSLLNVQLTHQLKCFLLLFSSKDQTIYLFICFFFCDFNVCCFFFSSVCVCIQSQQ